MFYYGKILGTGSYLPEKILTNDELSKTVDTSDEWITTRTGIKQRHIAAENENTSDLAVKASLKAIEASNLEPSDLDCIIVATTTPDDTFPSTAVRVQSKIGAGTIPAFDVQAVCTGFIYALTVAQGFIKSGMYKNILVVGAEKMSKIVDWKDRNTCVLFGDGAGAVVIQAKQTQNFDEANENGILATNIRADGNYYDILKTNECDCITMNGQSVFKLAVNKAPQVSKETIEKAGLKLEDIDFLIPHQANVRIIDAILKHLGMNRDQTILNIDKQANTSAASIPLALDTAIKEGKVKAGQNLLLTAMGGGFTWGSAVIKL